MRKRELSRLIARHIAPEFPDHRLVDVMLVRHDGAPIVRGFHFDRSQTSASAFRVDAFVQPLYVPSHDVSLGLSRTIGDYSIDSGPEESLFAQIVRDARAGGSWLESVSEPGSLGDDVMSIADWQIDTNLAREIRAYSLIYADRSRDAERELKRLRRRLRWGDPPDPELPARVDEVLAALDSSSTEARGLLDTWADETRRALQLPGRRERR